MTNFSFIYVIENFPKILQALPVTLKIVFVAMVLGIVLGALLAIVRIERVPVLDKIAAVLVSFVRGTPIFIQMFVIYYGLPMLLLLVGINIMRAEKMLFVYIAYGINAAAFFAEIFRSAILSVPNDQWDAALSIGHSKIQAYLRIITPQSAIIAIPSVGVMLTGLLQDTSLTIAMGVTDVVGKARALGNHNMHLLEAYIDTAIIFIILSILIERIFAFLEYKTRMQRQFIK
jgi:L-cystine transport system permease protein